MAYVVPTKRGTFEVRESHVTPKGPRSRTLATFREMTDEVIDKARSRALKPLETEELRSAAARAGASVPGTPVDRAAREALRLLAGGDQLDPMLRTLLLDALNQGPGATVRPAAVSDAARSATEWIGASPERRGEALRDLLELADALPPSLSSEKPNPPEKVVAIHEALRESRIPHAFGGGLALAYYAEPRMTTDIDFNVFIAPERWEEVRDALVPLKIDPAPAPPDREGRLELVWGIARIDVFFSQDALHDEMRSATRKVPFAESAIPIVAPEHLAVRKALCDRPKDWIDIEQILVATSPLDLPEIEAWLEAIVGESDVRLVRLREIAERLSLS